MTEVLGAAVAVLVAIGGVLVALGAWRLWAFGRTVAYVCRRLDAGAAADLDARLDELWRDVCELHDRHTRTVGARQDELDGRIAGIEPWIRHWARRSGHAGHSGQATQ